MGCCSSWLHPLGVEARTPVWPLLVRLWAEPQVSPAVFTWRRIAIVSKFSVSLGCPLSVSFVQRDQTSVGAFSPLYPSGFHSSDFSSAKSGTHEVKRNPEEMTATSFLEFWRRSRSALDFPRLLGPDGSPLLWSLSRWVCSLPFSTRPSTRIHYPSFYSSRLVVCLLLQTRSQGLLGYIGGGDGH